MSDELQALCFLAGANSIFYGEKLLTTPNPGRDHDHALMDRLGLAAKPELMASADKPDWLAAGLASSVAALYADEDRAGAAAGRADRRLRASSSLTAAC